MLADKKILIGVITAVVVAFGLMQLWPLNTDNPAVRSEPDWDSEQTLLLAQRACFDCHSNETDWAWYAHIVPTGNLLVKDVQNGRRVLNFSEWEQTCCTLAQIDEMATAVNKNEMPLPYYVVLHPEADLSDVERGQLVNGLIATMENAIGQE